MSSPLLLPADHPRIALMGRTAPLPGGGVRMGFPGIKFCFRYTGPAPVLHFRADTPDCCFNLSCNGWEPVVLHLLQGSNRIPLPTGPAGAEGCTIELVRRTETWQGMAEFLGLEMPPDTHLLEAPAWPARRLMFIGDSITCGEGIDLFPAASSPGPRWSNAARSFGMLLGRWLDAQVHLVSYGGRGLMRTWDNRTDQANAPQFFERCLPDDPSPLWNHGHYMPDAIVVCLGTNDFSPSLPDESTFTAAWLKFLARIRAVHAGVPLLLAESPIFPDAPDAPDIGKRRLLRKCLEAVVHEYSLAGDKKVRLAPVTHQPGTYLDAHPVAFQHERIALELLPALRALTGW